VQGATELVSKLCSGGMPKAFVPRVIKNLYAMSPLLFVPSVPPCYCLHSSPCSPPLCVTFICNRLTLSLHISEDSEKISKLPAGKETQKVLD